MKLSESRRRLSEIFAADPASVDRLTSEAFVELLEPWERGGAGVLVNAPLELRRFLYSGCVRFDRWAAPTPVVVDDQELELFDRFVAALVLAEPEESENLPVLRAHQLRTEFYAHVAITTGAGRAAQPPQNVGDIRERLDAIPSPNRPDKGREFEEAAAEVRALCEAMPAGKYRTLIDLDLPHAAVRRSIRGTCRWRGITVDYAVAPKASTVEGWTATGGTIAASGATRWPTGECHVSLIFHDLIDHAASTPHQTANPEPASEPLPGRPLSASLAYLCVTDLLAALHSREPEWVDPLWILTPRDISQLSVMVEADGVAVTTISALRLGGWSITAGTLPEVRHELGDLEAEPYWQLGHRQAQAYLALGATREAKLWVNMAAESLLDERIAMAVERAPDLAEKLQSGRLLFEQAEEVLADQRPDLAGTIDWPSSTIQPSRFAQLKGLYARASMAGTLKEATTAYGKVSARRNDLVHGRETELPPVEEVREALDALVWLSENLVLQEDGKELRH